MRQANPGKLNYASPSHGSASSRGRSRWTHLALVREDHEAMAKVVKTVGRVE